MKVLLDMFNLYNLDYCEFFQFRKEQFSINLTNFVSITYLNFYDFQCLFLYKNDVPTFNLVFKDFELCNNCEEEKQRLEKILVKYNYDFGHYEETQQVFLTLETDFQDSFMIALQQYQLVGSKCVVQLEVYRYFYLISTDYIEQLHKISENNEHQVEYYSLEQTQFTFRDEIRKFNSNNRQFIKELNRGGSGNNIIYSTCCLEFSGLLANSIQHEISSMYKGQKKLSNLIIDFNSPIIPYTN